MRTGSSWFSGFLLWMCSMFQTTTEWDSSRHVEVRKSLISWKIFLHFVTACQRNESGLLCFTAKFRKWDKHGVIARWQTWGGTYLARQKPGVLVVFLSCLFSYLHSIHRMQPFCLSFWKQKHYFYTNILYIRTRRNECQKCLNYFKHEVWPPVWLFACVLGFFVIIIKYCYCCPNYYFVWQWQFLYLLDL